MCNEKYDFIVVGAGVIGLSIAKSLSNRECTVLLIDQDEYATKASGTNLGQLSIADRDEGLEYEMAMETLSFYEDYAREFEFERCGGLSVFNDWEDYPLVKDIVEKKLEAGFEIEMIEKERVKEYEPYLEDVEFAVHSKNDGVINPFKLNNWLYDEAISNGVVFVTDKIVELDVNNGKVQSVIGESSTYTANEIILATGSWTQDLLDSLHVKLGIGYVRASAMVTQSIPKTMNGHVEDGVFLINKHAEQVFFGCTQTMHGSVMIAQANAFVKDYNTKVSMVDLSKCADLFLRKFPTLRDTQVVRQWSGITSISSDNLAYWGYLENVENLFIAAAFKGAYSLAISVGERTAKWLLDDEFDQRYVEWSPNREVL